MTATLEHTETATVAAADLKRAVTWAARALPRKPPHPVMGGMLLSLEDGTLTVSAFDYEVHASASVRADGDLPPMLVSGALLGPIAERLTADAALTIEGARLLVASTRGRYRLPLMVAGEFPSGPAFPKPFGTASDLHGAMGRVVHASDPDGAPTGLDCVRLTTGSELQVVCVNRHQFARATCAWSGEEFSALVDARRLSSLVAAMGDRIEVGVSKSVLGVSDGTCRASIVLSAADGAEPGVVDRYYGQERNFGHVDVDRTELLNTLGDVAPTLGARLPLVDMTFAADEISVASWDEGQGDADFAAPCDGTLDMQPRTIRFQHRFVIESLKTLPAERVRIAFGAADPNRVAGVVFAPLIDGEPDMANAHIIAPIQRTEVQS